MFLPQRFEKLSTSRGFGLEHFRKVSRVHQRFARSDLETARSADNKQTPYIGAPQSGQQCLGIRCLKFGGADHGVMTGDDRRKRGGFCGVALLDGHAGTSCYFPRFAYYAGDLMASPEK